jgi:N-acetylglucosaminyldiphosphoundecaprenol N-acetyl-beta-D-mannosaminyltransferase
LGKLKQEIFINKNLNALKAKVCMGVGGTIDVLSGNTKLAPEIYRKHGLEWLYRLSKEPKRIIRMMDLPKFIIIALLMRVHLLRR